MSPAAEGDWAAAGPDAEKGTDAARFILEHGPRLAQRPPEELRIVVLGAGTLAEGVARDVLA